MSAMWHAAYDPAVMASLRDWTDPLKAQWLTLLIHWAHVIAGVYWFGTVLFTRLVLFPSMRALPADAAQAVRAALIADRNRRLTNGVAGLTVALGVVRGLRSDALAEPTSPYGVTFIAAAVLGAAMLAFLFGLLGSSPRLRALYVAAFPVIFSLMVLMRFGV